MFACWSDATRRISRANRRLETPTASSGDSTLMTTVRPREVSMAANTRAIPPPPSSRSIE